MAIRIEERGPEGYTYRAVHPADVQAIVQCASAYDIVDQPEQTMAIAVPEPAGGRGAFGLWMADQLRAGRGLVLQLPPAVQGYPAPMDMFCAPDPSFGISVGGFATDSLNEARSIAGATPDSVIVTEPRGGWLELRRGLGQLSWGVLGMAAAAVAVAGYLIFGRR